MYILFFILFSFLIWVVFFKKECENVYNERQIKEFLENKKIDDLVIFSNLKSVIYFLEDILKNGSNIKLYFNEFTFEALYKEDISKLSFLLNNYPNFSLYVSNVNNIYSFIYSNNHNFCFFRNLKYFVFSDHLDFATKQNLKYKEMLLNKDFKNLNKENIDLILFKNNLS